MYLVFFRQSIFLVSISIPFTFTMSCVFYITSMVCYRYLVSERLRVSLWCTGQCCWRTWSLSPHSSPGSLVSYCSSCIYSTWYRSSAAKCKKLFVPFDCFRFIYYNLFDVVISISSILLKNYEHLCMYDLKISSKSLFLRVRTDQIKSFSMKQLTK